MTPMITSLIELSQNSDREKNLTAWLDPINLISQSNDTMLAVGAIIVEEIRRDVYNTLGYCCSAGIAHSKVGVMQIACENIE
jgi:hypothetical protein